LVCDAFPLSTAHILSSALPFSFPHQKNVHQSSQYFHELSPEDVDSMVELNVNSTSRMTYLVLPNMLARKRVNEK
jgi:NAD(P)-dependent dehydrogenase (short-subunit alcohol dehydrogenase family)